jgi:hypothetical protein
VLSLLLLDPERRFAEKLDVAEGDGVCDRREA